MAEALSEFIANNDEQIIEDVADRERESSDRLEWEREWNLT